MNLSQVRQVKLYLSHIPTIMNTLLQNRRETKAIEKTTQAARKPINAYPYNNNLETKL